MTIHFFDLNQILQDQQVHLTMTLVNQPVANMNSQEQSHQLLEPFIGHHSYWRKRREDSESTFSRPIALLSEVGSPTSIAIAEPSYTSEVFR
ncbi:26732_t:CDS:2, partial [Gigaspora margarita]